MPAFAFTGYDGPAHMSEESYDAPKSVPLAIISSVIFMAVAGWIWILSLLFCIPVG